MVKIVREFFLNGETRAVFENVLSYIPTQIERHGNNEYNILDEIIEPSRTYRKIVIHRESIGDTIPSLIRERLPDNLLHTASRLIEETIFYHKENKIQWSITNECDPIYTITGTSRFISMSEKLCKVVMLIQLRIEDLSTYIPNQTTRDLLKPFLESKIPDLVVDNIREKYTAAQE